MSTCREFRLVAAFAGDLIAAGGVASLRPMQPTGLSAARPPDAARLPRQDVDCRASQAVGAAHGIASVSQSIRAQDVVAISPPEEPFSVRHTGCVGHSLQVPRIEACTRDRPEQGDHAL